MSAAHSIRGEMGLSRDRGTARPGLAFFTDLRLVGDYPIDDRIVRRAEWVRGGCLGPEPPLLALPPPEDRCEMAGMVGMKSRAAKGRYLQYYNRFVEREGRPPTITESSNALGVAMNAVWKRYRKESLSYSRSTKCRRGGVENSLLDLTARGVILRALQAAGRPLTANDVAGRIGRGRQHVHNILLALVEAGLVREAGLEPRPAHRSHRPCGCRRKLWEAVPCTP